ncbi:MAG TPA: hypothetical protein VKB70_02050 [Gaiellaceae bacterium]|nr:hypothetical protein [Gaiellaceae bacterium]
MEHVIWIGGPSGSGKTTIARRLAIEHGLRYFGADKLMQAHHARGLERGFPAMTRWDGLTPDERWLGDPVEMADLLRATNAERWMLLIENVRELPSVPTVVEGTPLRPASVMPFVGEPPNAVWIFPTPAAQERNLTRRGGSGHGTTSDPERARRNRILREQIHAGRLERDAVESGAAFLRVEPEHDLDAAYGAVEAVLLPALERLPLARSPAERFALRRAENDDLAAHLHAFLGERPDLGTPETLTTRFACECGAERDLAEVELTLAAYGETKAGEGRVLAAGHRSPPV